MGEKAIPRTPGPQLLTDRIARTGVRAMSSKPAVPGKSTARKASPFSGLLTTHISPGQIRGSWHDAVSELLLSKIVEALPCKQIRSTLFRSRRVLKCSAHCLHVSLLQPLGSVLWPHSAWHRKRRESRFLVTWQQPKISARRFRCGVIRSCPAVLSRGTPLRAIWSVWILRSRPITKQTRIQTIILDSVLDFQDNNITPLIQPP